MMKIPPHDYKAVIIKINLRAWRKETKYKFSLLNSLEYSLCITLKDTKYLQTKARIYRHLTNLLNSMVNSDS